MFPWFRPVKFITTGAGSELVLNKDIIPLLESETRPVTVICVVGPYRTGKSYLLNRIMNKKRGFPLGANVEAETKGIWLWMGDFFGDPTRALILLDTEGFDGRPVKVRQGLGHKSPYGGTLPRKHLN